MLIRELAWTLANCLTRMKKQVRVEILSLDFWKTPSNQYIKSTKVATFENCEIFSNYFSYVWDYKATLSGGNNKVEQKNVVREINLSVTFD